MRDMLGSVNQPLAVAVGLLLSFIMGVLCSWRWVAFAAGNDSLSIAAHSDVSHARDTSLDLSRNRRSEALTVLLWLRGPDADIEEECLAIEETLGNSICHLCS